MTKLELVHQVSDKIVQVREMLKVARDKQQSYANDRNRDLDESEVCQIILDYYKGYEE